MKKTVAAVGEDEMPPEQRLLLVLGDRSALAEAGAHDGSVVYLFFITSIGDSNWLPFLDDHDVS